MCFGGLLWLAYLETGGNPIRIYDNLHLSVLGTPVGHYCFDVVAGNVGHYCFVVVADDVLQIHHRFLKIPCTRLSQSLCWLISSVEREPLILWILAILKLPTNWTIHAKLRRVLLRLCFVSKMSRMSAHASATANTSPMTFGSQAVDIVPRSGWNCKVSLPSSRILICRMASSKLSLFLLQQYRPPMHYRTVDHKHHHKKIIMGMCSYYTSSWIW